MNIRHQPSVCRLYAVDCWDAPGVERRGAGALPIQGFTVAMGRGSYGRETTAFVEGQTPLGSALDVLLVIQFAAALGAAERLVDDFFWSRWRFKVRVFDLFGVWCRQSIDETVEPREVAPIGTVDGLLHSMVARDQDRVGSAHVGEVPGGVGVLTPPGEPFLERLAVRTQRPKPWSISPSGDALALSEKMG